jgi:hypothetical protein
MEMAQKMKTPDFRAFEQNQTCMAQSADSYPVRKGKADDDCRTRPGPAPTQTPNSWS